MCKVALITGSASGLGKSIGQNFLKEGYKVVFTDFNNEKLQEVVAENKANGFDSLGIKCDVCVVQLENQPKYHQLLIEKSAMVFLFCQENQPFLLWSGWFFI